MKFYMVMQKPSLPESIDMPRLVRWFVKHKEAKAFLAQLKGTSITHDFFIERTDCTFRLQREIVANYPFLMIEEKLARAEGK